MTDLFSKFFYDCIVLGRLREHDMHTELAAENALMTANIRPATSLKAKGLATTFVSHSVQHRRMITKGVDLLNRISYHLNALLCLLNTKSVKNYLIHSKNNITLLTHLFKSIVDGLRTFEFFSHSMEEFIMTPLIEIMYRIVGGGEKKKATTPPNQPALRSWGDNSGNNGGNGSNGGNGGSSGDQLDTPVYFAKEFMRCQNLHMHWINNMSRGSSAHGSLSKENLHKMMTVLYVVLVKGKHSTEHRQEMGVFWVAIGVELINVHRAKLLGLNSAKKNIKNWGNEEEHTVVNEVVTETTNMKTFQMIIQTLNACFEDPPLRNVLFQAYYKGSGLSLLWLTLYDTIFHVGCCEKMVRGKTTND